MIVVVTVIGRYLSAVKFRIVLPNRQKDRRTCNFGLCDSKADLPSRGRNTTAASRKCTA